MRLKKFNLNLKQLLAGVSVIIFSFVALPFVNSINSLRLSEPLTKGYYSKQQEYLSRFEAIRLIAPNDSNAVVLAGDYPSLLLPAVSSVHVLAIRDARATPAADNEQRRICKTFVIKSFNQDILNQVKIKYIIAENNSKLAAIARANPNIKPIKKTKSYELFQNTSLDNPKAINQQCEFNE